MSVIVPLNLAFRFPEAAMGLSPSFAALTGDIKTQATAKITATAETFGLSDQAVNFRAGDPRDEIIAVGNGMQADLIVMRSNAHSATNRLLPSPNARSVFNHTPCDVMVYRQR